MCVCVCVCEIEREYVCVCGVGERECVCVCLGWVGGEVSWYEKSLLDGYFFCVCFLASYRSNASEQ